MFFIISVKRKIGAPELTLWVVMILSVSLPNYSPENEKVLCSRSNSYLVRRFLRSKWYPILDRYGAKLPLECPLHPQRDIFWKQEAGKSHHKTNHWTCNFCGKSFQTEKHIDQHMEQRHDDCLYLSEDAVCLADFCDIFRCDVLETIRKRDFRNPKQEPTTDLEVWKDKTALKSALQKSPSRDLTLYQRKSKKEGSNVLSSCNQLKQQQYNIFILAREKYQTKEDCFQPPSECLDCENQNATNSTSDPLLEDDVWTAYRKQKAQCNEDEMEKIRVRCEDLVHSCTIGLLAVMSATDFKDLYAELRQSLCEFLSCSRYWEDVIGGDRKFPWIAAGLLVILLSFGVCIAYYIVWGVTEDEIQSRVVPVIKTEEVKETVPERNGRSLSQGRSRSCFRYGKQEEEDRRERDREGSSTLPRRSRHHKDDVGRDYYRDEDGFRAEEQKRRAVSDRFSNQNSSFQESSPGSDIYEESLWPVAEEESDVEETRSDSQR